MRYLLVNDTSQTNNPGCQATVASLKELYHRHGHACIDTIPVGTGYEHFVALSQSLTHPEVPPSSARSRFRKGLRALRSWMNPKWMNPKSSGESILDTHQTLFHSSCQALELDHPGKFDACDFVLINGEGTLHHDRIAAYALLGWARLAKQHDLPVAIANCTIESFDPFFWSQLSRLVDQVTVREPCSFDYVKPYFPGVQLGADAIFSMPARPSPGELKPSSPGRVAYSPGVLSFEGIVNEASVARHLSELREQFEEVEYIVAEQEDTAFERVATRLGCRISPLRAIDADNVMETISQFDLIVSGRYHYCIFALLGGIPVVPLASNTWKMQGLIRMGGKATAPSSHETQLSGLRETLQEKRDQESIPILRGSDFDFPRLAILASTNVVPFAPQTTSVAA